ncbi:hypothetical protein [Silvanigrella sp.]|jgi:hypothetical protein|uniref:hypothetical protein n=1 Tax=Silvanigrella sp. TaxID=2024976 RepID=UPI0037C76905
MNKIILAEIEKSMFKVESISTSILEYTENIKNNFKIMTLYTFIEKINTDLCLNTKFISKINYDQNINCDESNLIKSFNLIINYIIKNITTNNNYSILIESSKIKKQNFLKIAFTFNGNLIDKNETDKMFNPFYLNKNNVNNNLDMVTAKKIIDSHQGHISCDLKDKNVEILILIPINTK